MYQQWQQGKPVIIVYYQGFIYWENIPPQFFYFPPQNFYMNNKYLVYAFFALSSAVLYCISNIALVKHELSQKYTRKSFHAAGGGGSPSPWPTPQTKNPRWNPDYGKGFPILDESIIHHHLQLNITYSFPI